MPKVAFVYSDQLSRHVLREDHPLQARRLRLTYELLESYGAFQHPDALLVAPSPATEAELLLIHAPEYIEAVEGISRGESHFDPARYNLSAYGDNPPYPGMYEASALSTGASLVAADLLLEGRARVAFSISGGLHHAAWDHASGFCIFNDPAVAIAHLVGRGLRVAYVDIDAHHGDGVQNAFYDTDRADHLSPRVGQIPVPRHGGGHRDRQRQGCWLLGQSSLPALHRRQRVLLGLRPDRPASCLGLSPRRAGGPAWGRRVFSRPSGPSPAFYPPL